ncbi:hypothetical protein ASPWEDRAFT_47212 [Aspergillus wentii DTO 134E9]|uniref:Oxidoreductase-like protein n=1 Tax=Aspergillus wentii DTO 134E9 TaxID=1073089 RepID=A0A1L9RZU5_ASPWE|nr:uncharacterized protein ASPWEDRAFT_47212 [Aspergillus wentii DTO 134E9]OJJ40367.1 hypothetical protein ASPWEDRAFT_47212 [Aspergillus wentii DTO 134E9]
MAKVDAAVDGDFAASSSAPPNQNHGPVEARSLSSITQIASNPPAYPRNPTQKKLDPLVLYIVRVPGSKDVFLSPLKPPTKASVSAEAINSSLYYLHVASPDDEILLEEFAHEREEEAKLRKEEGHEVQPELAHLNNVRRKPVGGGGGGNTSQPLPASPPLPALSQQQVNSPPQSKTPSQLQPQERPHPTFQLPGENVNPHGVSGDDRTARSPMPRRPLPPVPRDEASSEYLQSAHPGKKPHRWSALSGYINGKGLENWKERYEGRNSLDSRPPQLRPHSAHESPSHSRRGSPSRSPGQSPSRRPPRDHRSPEKPGFHITLIRRDPTHGIQWNVATMSTPRLDGGPIDIEINTPGYNRFLAQDEPLSLESLGLNLPLDGRNPTSLSGLKIPPKADPQPPSDPSKPRKFNRKLCVSRPQHEEGRGSMDIPRPSIDTTASGHGLSKLKSGYYTFSSPWNGTCTFSTSVNGRSLKCKHMIHMPTDAIGSHDSSGASTNPAVTVAEIRFNTPFQAGHLHHQPGPSHISPFTLSQTPTYKEVTGPDGVTTTKPSKRNSLALFLNPQAYTRPRAHSGASNNSNSSGNNNNQTPPGLTRKPSTTSTSSGAEFDEDRLDFTLAREPAGGGMRGKSAKLGKLIVEDEGIKMLDLVVASCMSVWWKGYYY